MTLEKLVAKLLQMEMEKKKKIKRKERLEKKKKKKILQPVTNSHPSQVWFCPGFKSEQGFGEAVPKY